MDDKTANTPNGRGPGEYTYSPLLPDDAARDRRAADQDAPFIWPDERPAPGERTAAVPGGEERTTPPPRLVPVPAGMPAPTWEWQNGGSSTTPAPAAGGWYGAPGESSARPLGETSPPSGGSGGGTWQQTPIGRGIMRGWPLILLGLSKLKWLAVLFKFKAFTTFGSMLVSLGAYALFFGWQFALGFIALLFIHEMGHAAVMRAQGIKTTPVVFIPMMGAVIGMREMPKNVFAEAQMALGGPILGSIGALACLGLWQATGAPIFVALAYSGFMLNLFNLIPVSPLDGGRAMAAISPWGWLVGIALMVLLFLRVHSLILGFILIVGGMEVFNRWRSRDQDRAYYEATAQQRLIVSAVYFGLAALLAFGMYYLQSHLLINRPGY